MGAPDLPSMPSMTYRFRLGMLALAAMISIGCARRRPTPAPPPVPPVVVEEPKAPEVPPFDATRLEPLHPRSLDRRIPILMFHDVVAERGEGGVYFDCTVDELKEMLDWFEEQGASFITLDQLHRHLVRGEAVPDGAVVLTFDDNYQGFHDNAFPILKERRIPSSMFVHTGFVGNKSGPHPKMDWDTLRDLEGSGLVEIASHTVSHPDDIGLLSLEKQKKELIDSKAVLERELGHPVPYFAYPVGKGDAETFAAVERAGYTMAFTMHAGPAEESPSILRLNRTIHSRYRKAWEESRDAARYAPAAVFETEIADQPVRLEAGEFDGVGLVLVKGGLPLSVRDLSGGRKSVGTYVREAGGVAGMNGTFFVNAALRGTDNAMIGPFRARNEGEYLPDRDPERLAKLVNRPLIAWGEGKLVVAPFQPAMFDDETGVRRLLPGMTDCFLAGAWIVHEGVARKRSEIEPYAARDFNDPRKRAFLGITEAGEVVLGATREVVTTTTMARGAAAAGIREAFLMDSGFSTSIVYDGKVLAFGHSTPDSPSRKVPHALVMPGSLAPIADPATLALWKEAGPAEVSEAQAEDAERRPRGRRRKR
ncbi:MAG: polysaccharide deacetylase family protein [Armatimonadota bacterium]